MIITDLRPESSSARTIVALFLGALLALTLLALAGCAGTQTPQPASEDEPRGFGMGGVDQQVHLLASVVEDTPAPWDLTTPEKAVRSYLDWVSYAYRTAESEAASQTQSAHQLVRTDAFVQAQLQEQKLMDQQLVSITFGTPSIEGSSAVLPAEEEWTYRYVSITEAGKTLSGPHTANYETTYKLVKEEHGWVVDDIEVKTLGSVE